MVYTEANKKADMKYKKAHIKRIPLDVQKENMMKLRLLRIKRAKR